TPLMDSASSLTDSAAYATVRTVSGDLIIEGSGALTSAVGASGADRAVSCPFAGLRLALRSVFVLYSLTAMYFIFRRHHGMSAGRVPVRHLSYLRMPKSRMTWFIQYPAPSSKFQVRQTIAPLLRTTRRKCSP